jgi:hypothetical protein
MHRMLALGAPTCSISSGSSACKGAEQADAGQGAPACPVSFYEGPNAVDRTLAKHCLASGNADVAVHSEV